MSILTKMLAPKKVPVTILTGFLGSGKTTLLNHILTEKHGLKIAVIQNQFGEVGVDDHLLKQNKVFESDQQVIEMMNGCICCTVRGDLSKIIKKLLIEEKDPKKKNFDAIIIETTGMADPAPVAQTFFVDQEVVKVTTLDGIITVVDAKHIIQHLKDEKAEGAQNQSIQQIAFADRILLNKTDLVSQQELEEVQKEIRAINQAAEIMTCQYSKIDPNRLMGIQAFNLSKVLSFDPQFLNTEQQHIHDQSISSCGCSFKEPISLGKLQQWISQLIQTKATDLFRYKGVINVVGAESPYVFQGVHMLFTGQFIKDGWKDTKERTTHFCFIGKNIDRDYLINGFRNCIAEKLSYGIGDRVQCKVEAGPQGWRQGVIIALWDEGNPYRISLNNGIEVHCPEQVPSLIKLKERAPQNGKKFEQLYVIRTEGNQLFTLQKYDEAIAKYSQGFALVEREKQGATKQEEQVLKDLELRFRKNEALCLLRNGKFKQVIQATNLILKISKDDTKALYMQGQALYGLQQFQGALKVLEGAQQLSNNPQINAALVNCKKALKL